MGNSDLVAAIVHYQQCLEKYTKRNNESRMLYCISKLYQLPVTVEHLEETGVGRTVNALRKANGEVGDAARSLVTKWKEMVAGEDSEQKDTSISKQKESENTKSHKHESKDKHKDYSSSSSHKESDTKAKYENKEKNSSSSYDEEESQSSQRKEKEETKHRKHEKSDKTHKHKSSKRKHDSDNSEIEENEYDDKRADNRKHKSSKYRTEDNDSDDRNHHKAKKDRNSSHKQKSSKRRYEDSDSEEEYEEEENGEEEEDIKHKGLSESELSDEETEEVEIKKQASKHHSKHKEERSSELREKSESRDKSKHKSKHKEKKEKKEHLAEDKVKKETSDHKSKEKHSHKEKSKSSSEKKNKDSKSTDKKSKHSSPKHRDSKERKSEKSSSRSSSTKTSMHENGIDSGSGASFAEALGMLMPGSSKTAKKKIAVIHPFPVEKPTKASSSSPDTAKTEPLNLLEKKPEPLALEINVANLLPEITPNYRPLGNFPVDNGQSKSKMTSEDEALSQLMYSKISRTKVYSGNKVIWAKVPSLFDLCTHVLQDNIDALEYTGGVPFSVLKPVIERANPDQLFMLEHHNPYLIEDTDELWQLHCQKEFRNKRREEMETWRDMYMRCLDEREAKLRALTANIKQSQDKSLPVRQTKLAYVDSHSIVKPPRNVARKQAKHGTGAGTDKKPLVTPSSRLSTLATAGAAGLIAVPNPGSRAASSTGSSSAVAKVKKAPLMQKTLALMKNRCFRR